MIHRRVQSIDASDEDDYGFFCDESGQNGHSLVDGSVLSLIVGNTFQGKGSYNVDEGHHDQHASAQVTASTVESIVSLNACIEQRNSRPDAVATTLGMSRHSSSLSTFTKQSIYTPAPSPHCSHKSSMSSLADGSESGDPEFIDSSLSTTPDLDNLTEAPVWIVSEGTCTQCDECCRRLVYNAYHTQPGRVFSRLFPVIRRRNSSSSYFPAHDADSGLLSSSSVADSANTFSGIQRLNSDEFDHPTAAALGGIRVLSGRFGQQWAEFELVVSSRTAVYRAWRTHADVGLLIDLVGVARKRQGMPNTNLAWEMLQRQRRWFNATEMLYLIDKRQILDLLFENLLYELDSPTQLLNFVDDETWSGSVNGLGTRAGWRAGDCTCEEA